ncbi:MAG: hypothetical protein GY758_18695 [Fuerstiella sp.]|jgi:hypothetical protein|nr:hypothetical protein [Fuerstiella sp.]MDG2127578.1 hypothetical protein [Fuerstiella sp.]
MLKFCSIIAAFLLVVSLSVVRGQEHSVELIDAAPDQDEVSAKLREQFADKGVRVKRSSSRTVCEIWFRKQWPVEAGFKATEDRLYPFAPGQLIGLLHFSRRGKDFRDQSVSSGWYTLRFGLQPIDGNHEGTSPTRDFLVMIGVEHDAVDKVWDVKSLMESSAEAAGSTHPAMMCLQRATEGSELAVRHDEAHDWWILHTVGKGTAGNKTQDVPFDLVVAGHATE